MATKNSGKTNAKAGGFFYGSDEHEAIECGIQNPDGATLAQCLKAFENALLAGDRSDDEEIFIYKLELVGKYKAKTIVQIEEVE